MYTSIKEESIVDIVSGGGENTSSRYDKEPFIPSISCQT